MNNCPFCDFENEIKYRLLEETEHFYLIPGLGAFIEPYLLIISKNHYESLSELSPESISELKTLETKAINFIKDTYKTDVMEYEHGCCSLTNEKSGACISHMHLVLVGTDENMLPKIEDQLGAGEQITDLADLKKLKDGLSSYMLYKKDSTLRVWPKKRLVSQFMRRLLCEEEGDKFNWRIHPHDEKMQELIKKWGNWQK